MIYIFISSDPVFFVLEEDGLLDDSEFKDGFDSTSALSVRVLQLPLRGTVWRDIRMSMALPRNCQIGLSYQQTKILCNCLS